MTNKIVFLDIDGPVIPYGCYFVNRNASYERVFSNTAIGYVKKLLELSDAKLVTNSMNNFYDRIEEIFHERDSFSDYTITHTLRDDLIAAGIPEDAFHNDWRTNLSGGSKPGPNPRLDAIYGWIKKNEFYGEDKIWIDFDDEDFAPELDCCINIDFHNGITFENFSKACKIFNVKVPVILF